MPTSPTIYSTKAAIVTADPFTRAYIVTLLWAESDPDTNGTPLDASYSAEALASETLETIKADCAKFQADNGHLFVHNIERAGHDFLLTRNRHGAGFWDGDWDGDAGDLLTHAAHAYKPQEFYIGDDGYIYAL
jgi:hypothetical protein